MYKTCARRSYIDLNTLSDTRFNSSYSLTMATADVIAPLGGSFNVPSAPPLLTSPQLPTLVLSPLSFRTFMTISLIVGHQIAAGVLR